MTLRFTKWLPALLLGAFFAHGSSVYATLELRATEVGGPSIDIIAGVTPGQTFGPNTIVLGSATVPLVFGDFDVFASLSSSNSPGGPFLADIDSSAFKVVNRTGGAHEIILTISDNGFTQPPSPVALIGTASGTFSLNGNGPSNGTASAIATAFADPGNAKFVNGFSVLNQTFTSGANPIQGSYSFTSPLTGPLNYGAPGFSMTVGLDFVVPGNMQLNGRSDVEQAFGVVPEPSTVVMALTAVPVLGYLGWRRRRTQA